MKFEAGQTYRTRNGNVARIYSTDGAMPFPIHGAILFGDQWGAASWSEDGFLLGNAVPDRNDLMPPKLTKTKYVFLYADGTVGMSDYPSLYRSGCGVVGTAVVELVEGEFGFELPLKRGG